MAARDLNDAFDTVGKHWDEARLRRFALACCQRVWHLIPEGPVREFVVEMCRENGPPTGWETLWKAARDVVLASPGFAPSVILDSLPFDSPKSAYFFADGLAKALANANVPDAKWPDYDPYNWGAIPEDPQWQAVCAAEREAQARLVWELFPEVRTAKK
jgi:hypothetical protein